MASSKAFLLLGLVFAVVLLMSSDVSEAAQNQEIVKDANNLDGYGHGHGHGYGHGHGHGGHHPPGHGGHGAAGESETNEN